MQQRPYFPYFVLVGGVLVASTAAIMIKFATLAGVPSLAVATGRLALAALIITPLTLSRHAADLRRLTRRDIGLTLLSGGFLAVHFAAWVSSLDYTSVASSTALVTLNPIFVALISFIVWQERLGRMAILGIVLS